MVGIVALLLAIAIFPFTLCFTCFAFKFSNKLLSFLIALGVSLLVYYLVPF